MLLLSRYDNVPGFFPSCLTITASHLKQYFICQWNSHVYFQQLRYFCFYLHYHHTFSLKYLSNSKPRVFLLHPLREFRNHQKLKRKNFEVTLEFFPGWRCRSVTEHLPRIHKALGSFPNTGGKKVSPVLQMQILWVRNNAFVTILGGNTEFSPHEIGNNKKFVSQRKDEKAGVLLDPLLGSHVSFYFIYIIFSESIFR